MLEQRSEQFGPDVSGEHEYAIRRRAVHARRGAVMSESEIVAALAALTVDPISPYLLNALISARVAS